MEAKKVYESIIKLLFNVIRNDELKYYLYTDKKYREKFVNLVNNLLTLEIDDNASYNEHQWAKTFGQAIVIISKEKQRIQKNEKSLNEVYADYTDFISLTSTEYKKFNLTDTKINFLPEDILNDSKISEEKIEQIKEKIAADQKLNDTSKTDVIGAGSTIKQNKIENEEYQNPNINFNSQIKQLKVVENPLTNPRFYSYNKKQRWFPIIKKVFAIFLLLTVVAMTAISIFTLVSTINFPDDSGSISHWVIKSTKENDPSKLLSEYVYSYSIDAGAGPVLSKITFIIITLLFSAYISYSLFRKPRNLNEKYRMNSWVLIGSFLLVIINIVNAYPYLDPGFLKSRWEGILRAAIDTTSFNLADFNKWWSEIFESKNIILGQGLAIFSFVMMISLTLFTLVIMFVQPRRDREKIQRAVTEYQNAIGAMMQGQEYEMDPTLFDNDEETIIVKKSKFRLWLDDRKSKKNKKK